jgi:ankyrin repeat protein
MEQYTSDESDESDGEPYTSYNIHDAARCADVPALQIFLAEGDSPDVLSDNPDWRNQRTPLHELFMHNGNDESDRMACFELLREAGANLEARVGRHPQGSTVVHYAIRNPKILSLLIEAGVNVNVANSGGYTPLHWAARGDFRTDTESVELLLRAGAAVNTRITSGLDGYTPFDIALDNGHRRAYPLFLRAGAEFQNSYHNSYTLRVQGAGGFKKYAQNHLARMTKLFAANGRRVPPEVVRQIMKFWLHAGYY